MTSNHQPRDHERPASHRPDGALLAGVCAGIATRLDWNVWAIRGLFAFGLFIQTIGTGVVYIILAALLSRFEGRPTKEKGSSVNEPQSGELRTDELRASELKARNERIADLERRFKEMERETGS